MIQNEIRDRFMKSVNSISLFAYLMPYSSYYIAIRNAILEIKKNSFGDSEFSFEHASKTRPPCLMHFLPGATISSRVLT